MIISTGCAYKIWVWPSFGSEGGGATHWNAIWAEAENACRVTRYVENTEVWSANSVECFDNFFLYGLWCKSRRVEGKFWHPKTNNWKRSTVIKKKTTKHTHTVETVENNVSSWEILLVLNINHVSTAWFLDNFMDCWALGTPPKPRPLL